MRADGLRAAWRSLCCVGLALAAQPAPASRPWLETPQEPVSRPLASSQPAVPLARPARAADLVILHFNDFHGQILPLDVVRTPSSRQRQGGFPVLAGYIGAQRRAHGAERVWVTNGGDWFQGTPEGNDDHGRGVVEAFGRLQLTASVIGNHEYDFGERNVKALVDLMREPALGANVLAPPMVCGLGAAPSSSGPVAANVLVPPELCGLRPPVVRTSRAYARPFVVQQVGGLRVALVGLVAEDTKQVSTGPFWLADESDVVQFGDEARAVERLLPVLQSQADVIVLITHCGLETDRALARRFPQVPLILGGHSHTALQRGYREGGTLIVQSSGKGTAISRVEVALNASEPRFVPLNGGLVELTHAEHPPDAETAAWCERRFGHLRAVWDTEIGRVEGAPDTRQRAGSTPAGNFVAALIRKEGQAQLGFTNKGGIRSTLQPGPLTRRQVYELLPFENSVVTLELTGEQLFATLQASLARGRRPLEVDGGSYRYEVVEGERELLDLKIGSDLIESGKQDNKDKRYLVATNSFLARGGDGLEALAKATVVREGKVWMRDLLLQRLQQDPVIVLVAEERVHLVR
jgi:5'-nucleotidase